MFSNRETLGSNVYEIYYASHSHRMVTGQRKLDGWRTQLRVGGEAQSPSLDRQTRMCGKCRSAASRPATCGRTSRVQLDRPTSNLDPRPAWRAPRRARMDSLR